jgi:seryl-tRNA synthetase
MTLPCSTITSSHKIRINKGTARDRWIKRQFETAKQIAKTNSESESEILMLLSQVLEEREGSTEQINEEVAKSAGISQEMNTKINLTYSPLLKEKKRKRWEVEEEISGTVVRFKNINDEIIKVTTGFTSVRAMVAFICICCDGDIEKIRNTTTSLTWLGEWCIYFESIWGRGLIWR